jgi:hypothetical protein
MQFIRIFESGTADQEEPLVVLELLLSELRPVGGVRLEPGCPLAAALDCSPPKRVHGCDVPVTEDFFR